MSKRTWLFIAAFGVIFVGSNLGYSQTVGPVEKPQNSQEQTTEQSAVETADVIEVAPAIIASPDHDQGAAQDSGAHPQEDTYLIWGDGWAQWLMAITGFVALILSGWAVWLLKQTLAATQMTLKEAERATKLADDSLIVTRQIGTNQLRPWLLMAKIDIFQTHNSSADDGTIVEDAIVIRVVWQNFGQSPASNVQACIRADFLEKDQPHPIISHVAPERSGVVAPNAAVTTKEIGLFGEDLIRFYNMETDIAVYSKVTYALTLDQGSIHETELMCRCWVNGYVDDQNGHRQPRISQTFVGPQNNAN